MTDPHDPRVPHDEAAVQQELDRAAPELGLELEEVRSSLARSVGALIVPVEVTPTAEVEIDESQTEPVDDAGEEIRKVLETWEGASPGELVETWRTHGTRPVVAVGANWIGPVDEEKLREGLESEEFRKTLREYPLYHPRRVTLSDLETTYLGGVKAVVTYRVEEEYRNGKVFAGNAGAILIKAASGPWKVALFTKRTRFLDFQPVG